MRYICLLSLLFFGALPLLAAEDGTRTDAPVTTTKSTMCGQIVDVTRNKDKNSTEILVKSTGPQELRLRDFSYVLSPTAEIDELRDNKSVTIKSADLTRGMVVEVETYNVPLLSSEQGTATHLLIRGAMPPPPLESALPSEDRSKPSRVVLLGDCDTGAKAQDSGSFIIPSLKLNAPIDRPSSHLHFPSRPDPVWAMLDF